MQPNLRQRLPPKGGACEVTHKPRGLGKAVANPLRLQWVVETHRWMLPQSAALKGQDQAGER